MSEQKETQPSSFLIKGVGRSVVTTFEASTTVNRIFKNDPKRIALIISNNTDTDIWIDPRNEVSTTLGIKIAKSGGYFELERRLWGQLVTSEWFGVSSATKTVRVIEILEA